jgi:hypothetical protein
MAGKSRSQTSGCVLATRGKSAVPREPLRGISGATQKLTVTINADIGCAGPLHK